METGMAGQPATEAGDTFPKLLAGLAADARRPARPIGRRNTASGRPMTGRMSPARSSRLAAGLADLGLRARRPADRGRRQPSPALLGDGAAQSLGGVPVPVYQDSVTEELAYVVEHAGARFALAENQEQIDKLLEIQKSGAVARDA